METAEIVGRTTTPLTAPAFPPGLRRFTNREYFNVVYRTTLEAAVAAVPEPLRVDDALVRFEVMHMGEVDGFGPYTECGQAIEVRHGSEHGEYLHAMYLDNFPAITAGREASAYPKAFGSPRLYAEQGALVGTLDFASLRVATATMGYKHAALDAGQARERITVPTYLVKIIPGYRGHPRVCELVRTEISDVTVKEAWTGSARLQLFEHALAPLADLPVLEVVEASHVVTDLTLAPIEPVHDYLAEREG